MPLDFITAGLAELERAGLLRDDREAGLQPGLLDACSNDYLGYGRHPVSRETLARLDGVAPGAGASRLIHGTTKEHLDLEDRLAAWVGLPAALLFTSGYAANVGTLTALLGPGDLVASDALNHASIIDGCRLSRAQVAVYDHASPGAAARALASAPQARRRWLVTETYFSMDGDCPDLPSLAGVCRNAGAGLIVDEAHALGVHGPAGAGICAEAGVAPDVLVGTLGKALGAQGAFVAGSAALRTWLWNRSRALVFSTAMSPLLSRVASVHAQRAAADNDSRNNLRQLHAELVAGLAARGVPLPAHRPGPIVPVVLGDIDRAVSAARKLADRGYGVRAIRPPTVPQGTARLRITLHATMTRPQVRDLATAIADACLG